MLTLTDADLKKFTPNARCEYVTALLGGLYQLRTAGILENSYRLSHFMAQVGHETGGFTVLRESLSYTSSKRLREVWPARFRGKSDTELKPLLNNGPRLGDIVYLGRMGNVQPGDGYDFRGGGFLQTTGREAVANYCQALGLDLSPSLLDDPSTTLQFACLEWQQSKCNDYADENDLTKVSKAINTGSASGNVKPVGMQDRQQWFAKAWAIWGEKGRPDTPPDKPMTLAGSLAKIGAPVLLVSETVRQSGPYIPSVPQHVTDTVANIASWKGLALQVGQLGSEAWVSGGAGVGVATAAYALARKYLVKA